MSEKVSPALHRDVLQGQFPQVPQTQFPHGQRPQSQQPIGRPMMTITGAGMGGNRNAFNKPVQSNGLRDWSFGIFDCFSACETCVYAWCCPCCVYGKNSSRLRHLTTRGARHPSGGDVYNADCMTYGALLCCGCPCVAHMGTRRDIRQRYSIEGGGCGDCCWTWFCPACALTQESREVGLEESSMTLGPRI